MQVIITFHRLIDEVIVKLAERVKMIFEFRVWDNEENKWLTTEDEIIGYLEYNDNKMFQVARLSDYGPLSFIALTGAKTFTDIPICDGDIVLYNEKMYLVEMVDFAWALINDSDGKIPFADIADGNGKIDCRVIGSIKYNTPYPAM